VLSAKLTLLTPALLGKPPGFWASRLRYPELARVLPPLEPYSRLSDLYHEYSASCRADYTGYLQQLARHEKRPIQTVLDVACGCGTLTEKLAAAFPEVVGIDGSEAMLSRASQRCARLPGVRLVRGDFRRFQLDQRFDAAVSGTNSLNYIEGVHDLNAIFNAVSSHLQPGGWFAFDAFTEPGMRMLSGRFLHVEVQGERFAIRFQYDPKTRRETADVLFASGVETHIRVPIAPKDVQAAAASSGLRLRDYFALPFLPGRWYSGALCYYLLRKEGDSP